MNVQVKITRNVQEVQEVTVNLDVEDLMDDSIRDAVENKIATGDFEINDADTHVMDTWEVEDIDEA